MKASVVGRVLSLGAAMVAATAGTVLMAPAAAQAGGCENALKSCGAVNNNSRFAMHVTTVWNSGRDKCARWTGTDAKPDVVKCKQTWVAPFEIYGGKKTVNGKTTYIDVDAFTYNSTDYYWNDTRIIKGQWIKLNGGSKIKCTAEIGALPRCA